VLTNQSTIIFIFFRPHAEPGGENSHTRGDGIKAVVALSLNREPILSTSWRELDSRSFELIVNRGSERRSRRS
jgi:hypothetical protein